MNKGAIERPAIRKCLAWRFQRRYSHDQDLAERVFGDVPGDISRQTRSLLPTIRKQQSLSPTVWKLWRLRPGSGLKPHLFPDQISKRRLSLGLEVHYLSVIGPSFHTNGTLLVVGNNRRSR